MLRAPALALVLAALPLAGCLGPGATVTMEVMDFARQPRPAENATLVQASLRLSVTGGQLPSAGTTLWVQDASRKVLLVAHQAVLNLTPGRPADVNFTLRANGLSFPVKFIAQGEKVQAEAWPPIAGNTHPFATRLATGNATWAFVGTYATDRQVHHFVVDNTAIATAASEPVKGTLAVRQGGQDRLFRVADLAPGTFDEGTVLVREGEVIDVAWTGDPVDVLVFVGDDVYAQYRAAAGR